MNKLSTNRNSNHKGVIVALCAFALVVAGCSSAEEQQSAPTGERESSGGQVPMLSDAGVTPDPCVNPAGGTYTPGNGCIYLGILSDLTVGPFSALGPVIQTGQQDFWGRVNKSGGIGGFDIDIDTYTKDTRYSPQDHNQAYNQIEPNILMLAQTLGTETTESILKNMDEDDVLAAPLGWWSGFHFENNSLGLVLPSGYSYCLESMLGLDWFSSSGPRKIGAIAVVGYRGDYGGDVRAGAEIWASENEVPFKGFITTATNALVGSQDAAVSAVLSSGADVVLLGVGPLEAAEIVGKVAIMGGSPGSIMFLGAGPTWNPALLNTPSAPALVSLYTHVAPWEDYIGSSEGHAAMREAFGSKTPINAGYSAGWVFQYPVKALLEAAAASGDLTRANLRSLVDGLEVDYEGVLPATRMGGEPGAGVSRSATISRVSIGSPNGLETVVAGFTGPTADAFVYEKACSGS